MEISDQRLTPLKAVATFSYRGYTISNSNPFGRMETGFWEGDVHSEATLVVANTTQAAIFAINTLLDHKGAQG